MGSCEVLNWPGCAQTCNAAATASQRVLGLQERTTIPCSCFFLKTEKEENVPNSIYEVRKTLLPKSCKTCAASISILIREILIHECQHKNPN